MTTTSQVTARSRTMLNKVPEVTMYFWIIKILRTAVGESHPLSTWLHQDLPHRLEHLGVPITVVTAGSAG